jgi:acyl CoA:acetate/3-ketoacid CoA transferase beta subunit
MEHNTKEGGAKILPRCTLPLTGAGVVDLIITDLAVISVIPEGLLLEEIAPGVSITEVQTRTEAKLLVPRTPAVIDVLGAPRR